MLAFDVHDLKERWAEFSHVVMTTVLGAVFVTLAVISIEYDETIAPTLTRLMDGWSTTTTAGPV